LQVDAESGPITVTEWQDGGLGMFPFRVVNAELEQDPASRAEAAVGILSDERGGLLLQSTGHAAIANVRGTLRIGFTSDAARALRPVLTAGLRETRGEQA
jgi:hypothetical protein